MSPLSRAVATFETKAAFSRAVGCTKQDTNRWLNQDRVPPAWCKKIEKAVHAGIRANALSPDPKAKERNAVPVYRYELRPDYYDPPKRRARAGAAQDAGQV